MPASGLTMRRVDPGAPDIRAVVEAHLAHSRRYSPDTSCHTMTAEELAGPDIQLWGLYDGAEAVGCGALKALPARVVEVKSVHVIEAARGRGLSRVIMAWLIRTARETGHVKMVLETGSDALQGFDAARGLYVALGFAHVEVIPGYDRDPNSAFMALDLRS